jgi:hypothetical protein
MHKQRWTNLFLKLKFPEPFIHAAATSLGSLWKENPCMTKVLIDTRLLIHATGKKKVGNKQTLNPQP